MHLTRFIFKIDESHGFQTVRNSEVSNLYEVQTLGNNRSFKR